MSVRSMTGFARLRRSGADGDVLVSLKSVNHRGLDMHFRLPAELEPFEQDLRAAIKRRAVRGHFQVQAAFTRSGSAAGPALNRPLLDAYLAAFRQAREELGLAGEPDLNAALALPGMICDPAGFEPGEEVRGLLLGAFEEALDALDEFREREGGQIASEMRARAAAISGLAAQMEELRARAVPAFQARLVERLSRLLEPAPVEPQRIAQEAAILADRSDIGEELARLKIHAAEVDKLLAAGGEVGKKLDFLLQEMNREANTILSKTNGAGELGLRLTALALETRAEIEKIREQSLNLE